MTRIRIPDVDETDPSKRALVKRAALVSLRPAHAAANAAMVKTVMEEGTLPRQLIELVRLRFAYHAQCRTCMVARYHSVTEELVAGLADFEDAPNLDERTRAALRFADKFDANPRAIDDDDYNQLREHFDEGELVELGFVCSLFCGGSRVFASWDITEDLPPSFQVRDGSEITPWGHDDLVALTPRVVQQSPEVSLPEPVSR